MLRILHVSPYFAPAFCYGGPPHSILGLCRAQQRRGAQITVFTTTAAGSERLPPSVSSPSEYDGIRIYRFPLALGARFFRAPELVNALEAAAGAYDLIHVHGIWNWVEWSATNWCRRAAVPYVISVRGMLHSSARRHGRWRKEIAYRFLEARALRGALFLHATSADEAETLKSLAVNDNIVELPNGVDLPGPSQAIRGHFREQYGIPADAPILAWIGRIHPIKRLDILAEAFGRVRRAIPNARLVIAGPDEAGHRASIVKLISAFDDAVIWTGPLDRDGKNRLLADASLLVACSDVESFGISVAEAMAAAVPVVVTKTCPWPQIEQRGCGRWVPQNAEAVGGAIVDVLADPRAAEAMGRNGRRLAEEEFAWDAIGSRMLEQCARRLKAREI